MTSMSLEIKGLVQKMSEMEERIVELTVGLR